MRRNPIYRSQRAAPRPDRAALQSAHKEWLPNPMLLCYLHCMNLSSARYWFYFYFRYPKPLAEGLNSFC